MLEKKLLKIRGKGWEDIEIERIIDYTLKHNGNPVEIKPSSVESIIENFPFDDWTVDAIETHMTDTASTVYRGRASKINREGVKNEMLFYIEKVF